MIISVSVRFGLVIVANNRLDLDVLCVVRRRRNFCDHVVGLIFLFGVSVTTLCYRDKGVTKRKVSCDCEVKPRCATHVSMMTSFGTFVDSPLWREYWPRLRVWNQGSTFTVKFTVNRVKKGTTHMKLLPLTVAATPDYGLGHSCWRYNLKLDWF